MSARSPAKAVITAVSIYNRDACASKRRIVVATFIHSRNYASKSKAQVRNRVEVEHAVPQYDVRSALDAVSGRTANDPINPPRSTLPPPLELPTRGSEAAVQYWWSIGRAYGRFYKDGIRAVWFNYKAASLLRQRIFKDGGAKDVTDAVSKKLLTRSEFQLLARNNHDISKLPLFALLVAIFGEWLPLLVPFVPNAVPGTSRIPKQVRGMRLQAEERRRNSFRLGIAEPSVGQWPETAQSEGTKTWPVAFDDAYRRKMIGGLRADQLLHLSTTLGLHSRVWERLQLAPPRLLLSYRVSRRLKHLTLDDLLLLRSGVGLARLSTDELHMACEARGLDIMGKPEEQLRTTLSWWLERQERDAGRGRALLPMLFRRLAMRDWVELNLEASAGEQS